MPILRAMEVRRIDHICLVQACDLVWMIAAHRALGTTAAICGRSGMHAKVVASASPEVFERASL